MTKVKPEKCTTEEKRGVAQQLSNTVFSTLKDNHCTDDFSKPRLCVQKFTAVHIWLAASISMNAASSAAL